MRIIRSVVVTILAAGAPILLGAAALAEHHLPGEVVEAEGTTSEVIEAGKEILSDVLGTGGAEEAAAEGAAAGVSGVETPDVGAAADAADPTFGGTIDAATDTAREVLGELVPRSVDPAEGAGQVEAMIEQPPAVSAAPASSGRSYTVRSGDTLGSIAAQELGSSGRYNEIYDRNRATISDPNSIEPGQVLSLP